MGHKPRIPRSTPVVLGDGIELWPLAPVHAPALFTLVDTNRERLREWMPWVDGSRAVSAVADFIDRSVREDRDGLSRRFTIAVGGEVAGVIGLDSIVAEHRRASIGYWIDGACEGHGIVSRAVIAVCDHGFARLRLNRIEIHCGTENWRSRRIPERLGFTNEGILRQRERVADRFVDHAVYAMLAADWRRF